MKGVSVRKIYVKDSQAREMCDFGRVTVRANSGQNAT